ncbi:response regulator [Crenothrix sp.]|uniref:response regulator n=1 Tax=Crenothrix sp. TaxID=3100433 RepID=UPI00374D09B1
MTISLYTHQVLIVEDSDEDFDTALNALRKTGLRHKVHRAITGDECLILLRGTSKSPAINPDFILMDVSLPGLDGRQTLNEIKTDSALKHIAIVMFSTSSNQADIKLCYEFGANAYHLKPFLYPEHISILEKIFNYWLSNVQLLNKKYL